MHTHLAVLLRRITGFRCYSGAADVPVHRQRPKARYQLNTDTPHHGFRDYRGLDVPFLTQSAVLQTLTPILLFISFPLICSCLLCSPSLSSGKEEKEPNVCVCLLGQVNIWNDRGWRWLECWRRCLRAKWRTIRGTAIRCMHVDRAAECSPWTVWCHLPRRSITQWEHSIKLQSNSIAADSQIKLMPAHMPKGAVTSTPRYYSCALTRYYFDVFSLGLVFSYWSNKRKSFQEP